STSVGISIVTTDNTKATLFLQNSPCSQDLRHCKWVILSGESYSLGTYSCWQGQNVVCKAHQVVGSWQRNAKNIVLWHAIVRWTTVFTLKCVDGGAGTRTLHQRIAIFERDTCRWFCQEGGKWTQDKVNVISRDQFFIVGSDGFWIAVVVKDIQLDR